MFLYTSKEQLRIVLVLNSFPSASETFLFNLVTGLEKEGHHVTVCSGNRKNSAKLYAHRMQEWSGSISYLPGSSKFQLIMQTWRVFLQPGLFIELVNEFGIKKALLQYLSLKSILAHKPDVIHFAFSGIGVRYIPIINYLNRKSTTVVSCRGTGEKVKPILKKQRASELSELFSRVNMVHCVSKDIQISILKYGLNVKNSFINYPSIILKEFNYKKRDIIQHPQQVVQIVTTGRLHYQKGYIYALGAIQKLITKKYNIHYHILGEGPDRELLEYLSHELNISDHVTLHGRVSSQKVKAILEESHIFLLPSLYEGIANAALEAMASGVPVVSTNAGGMEEVIKNEINGVLVNRFDELALANSISRVIDNYPKAIIWAEKGYDIIKKNHQMAQQIEKFLEHYQLLVRNKSNAF